MPAPKKLSIDDFVSGVTACNPAILARAVTLIESSAPHHRDEAREVLEHLLPLSGNSLRIGISGVPGAGKSTFIEHFGLMLCEAGHRVAVLAIDPSSAISGGSILGDKTRMESLSRNQNVFIRPSPTGGTLGGVARKTRETMVLCEAAGFDVILVETVGVGQSEIAVRSLVDIFLLLLITGAGDDLQTFKKGVIEIADLMLINKADGENQKAAESFAAECNSIFRLFSPPTPGWTQRALACSSLTGGGLSQVWTAVQEFRDKTKANGSFSERRKKQLIEWMDALVVEGFREQILQSPDVKELYRTNRQAVENGELTAGTAADKILACACGAMAKKRKTKESK